MIHREIIPVGRLGQRVRKAFVAGGLFACTGAALQLVRDPALDGWWDAFNWPQLFLYAPYLFFFGAVVWQLVCCIAEWFDRKTNRRPQDLELKASHDSQRTLKFWLRDSSRIFLLYVTTCLIGNIPTAANYLSEVRGWRLHLWWSNVVGLCLLLMIALWWILERVLRRTEMQS
jgi:hypothetical protein